MSATLALSPAQAERLERLAGRSPATTFDVVAQDAFSGAVTVEHCDAMSEGTFRIAANGRAVYER